MELKALNGLGNSSHTPLVNRHVEKLENPEMKDTVKVKDNIQSQGAIFYPNVDPLPSP